MAKSRKMPRRIIRNAFAEAWEREAHRVANGQGTRQWTEREQLELLSTGKVVGYSVHHMKNMYKHPEWADKVENFQFLQNYFYARNPDNEHDIAHRANPDGSTNGFFDHETGDTYAFDDRPPNIKNFVRPLKAFYLKGHSWETQTDIDVLRSRYTTLRRDITEQEKDLIRRKGINYVLGLKPQSPVVIGKVRDLHVKNTKRSWREEIKMIALQRKCSRPWTHEELGKLLRTQRVDGFEPRTIEGNFSTLEQITIDNIVFVPYKSPVQSYSKELFDIPNDYFENIAAERNVSVAKAIYDLTKYRLPQQTAEKRVHIPPKVSTSQRQKQISAKVRKKAKDTEITLIKKGQGTCLWTLEQQERWLCIGKGQTRGFGAHLICPELGDKVENVIFSDEQPEQRPTPVDGKLPRRQRYELEERFIDTDTYKTHFMSDKAIEDYVREKERQAKRAADTARKREVSQRPSVKSYTKQNGKKKSSAGRMQIKEKGV